MWTCGRWAPEGILVEASSRQQAMRIWGLGKTFLSSVGKPMGSGRWPSKCVTADRFGTVASTGPRGLRWHGALDWPSHGKMLEP